jgi:hypothetical protein
LLLKHNAEVNQGANHFRGDFIEYDTLTSTVKANKDENSQTRVHAIIQPAAEKNTNGQAHQAAPASKPAASQASPGPAKPKDDAVPAAPATSKP